MAAKDRGIGRECGYQEEIKKGDLRDELPSQKKKVPASNCVKCGKGLKESNLLDNLCTKCRSRLPECFGCHARMAPQYGYMSVPGRKVGKHEICNTCDYELNKKGYLHISHGKIDRFLMPNGRVRIKK